MEDKIPLTKLKLWFVLHHSLQEIHNLCVQLYYNQPNPMIWSQYYVHWIKASMVLVSSTCTSGHAKTETFAPPSIQSCFSFLQWSLMPHYFSILHKQIFKCHVLKICMQVSWKSNCNSSCFTNLRKYDPLLSNSSKWTKISYNFCLNSKVESGGEVDIWSGYCLCKYYRRH